MESPSSGPSEGAAGERDRRTLRRRHLLILNAATSSVLRAFLDHCTIIGRTKRSTWPPPDQKQQTLRLATSSKSVRLQRGARLGGLIHK
jgi:hypothetical protein